MSGNQHIVAGYSLLALSYNGIRLIQTSCPVERVVNVTNKFVENFIPNKLYILPVCFLLFTIGLLLPDIDSPNSKLGRYFYVPVEHRTWLHSFYFLLGILFLQFLPLGIFYIINTVVIIPVSILSCFMFFAKTPWLLFGSFLHLVCDSPSKCGICWFRPVSGYRHYGKAKIKKRHRIVLYTNDTQAWVLCTILQMLALYACYQNRHILFSI